MSQIAPLELAERTLALLAEEAAPGDGAELERLMRALADHVIDEVSPASEFDLVTLSAFVDGTLDDGARASAEADLSRNPRKLRQVIELTAVQHAFEEDSSPATTPMGQPALDFAPPPVAPVIDLAERRSQRRWIATAASLAAAVLLGLFLLVPGKSGLPGPVSLDVLTDGPTLRSGSWTVGDELALVATVDPDAEWAVIAVAEATPDVPVRVWVAGSSALGTAHERDAQGRVVVRERLAAPAGRRAYLVVASHEPLAALPALAPGWEATLRDEPAPEAFARSLQGLVDAEAGEREWRVSRAASVAVAEPDPLAP